jgi:NADH-quinone oxidoreductase subunit N
VYVLVALGSFGVILLAARKGFEADRLDDYRGLAQRDPLLAAAMMVLMFSTAGVPPFVGFWAKLRIFQVLWESNHLWLVVIAAAMSVVGAYYYLRVIKLMYFDPPPDGLPATASSVGVRLALGLNAVAVLGLGVLPGPLLELCARLIH